MPVETTSLFANVIQDHLELKRRNAELEDEMPIDKYRAGDPFENHPLFKTEEQARIEETMDGVPVPDVEAHVLRWPGEESTESGYPSDETTSSESLWSRSRDFDWGD